MSNAKIVSIIDHETAREALARQHDIELAARSLESDVVEIRFMISDLRERVKKLEKG